MADRTSAEVFGKIFKLLAKNPTDEHKAIAREVWGYMHGYDFSPYQMYADGSCFVLGLAQRGIHPDYPADGVVTLFLGEKGFDFEEATE